MIREPNNVDFYTTGRFPTEEEFAVISKLIKKLKAKGSKKTKPVKKGTGTIDKKEVDSAQEISPESLGTA